MTEDELKQVESQFSVKLPSDYRKLLLDMPAELVAMLEWHSSQDSEEETMLFRTEDCISNTNEWVRDADDDFEFDPNDATVPWPDDWFVIGGDVGGNLYCLKRNSDGATIYHWHQGTTDLEQIADGVAAYIRFIFGVYADLAASDFE
jgi:hypothetical protein